MRKLLIFVGFGIWYTLDMIAGRLTAETPAFKNDIVKEIEIVESSVPESKPEPIVEVISIEDIIKDECQKELDKIESIGNNREWFIAYKNLIEEYSDVYDPPESVYNYYTEDEIYLMCRVVETECFERDFDSKCNVASVIFNRIDSGMFGDSVEEVITSPKQFAYTKKIITEDTILAVEYAFMIEDTTNGCMAFRSDIKPAKWYDWEYVFTDKAGHHFFK